MTWVDIALVGLGLGAWMAIIAGVETWWDNRKGGSDV